MTMTDTTRNLEIPTFSYSIFTKKNHPENFGYYRKISLASRLLSTLDFPLIQSCEPTVSDTNKDVFINKDVLIRRNQANLKVVSRIKELAKYKEGWYDGIEGTPADSQAIKDAIRFAQNLDFNNIHIPYISLATDGEVNFWWDLKTIKLDLGFYGDGTYSYYAKLKNGKEFFGDDEDSNSTLPLKILEKLKK